GTTAVGVDYGPALLESARARAVAEGLDAEFREADAEDLPFGDDEFDAALSVFGSMFAPDHRRTAHEIVRVTRPGEGSRLPPGPRTDSSARCSAPCRSMSRRRPGWPHRCYGEPRGTWRTCSATTSPRRGRPSACTPSGSSRRRSTSRSSVAGTDRR